MAKELFVELAEQELSKEDDKINISRLSVLTGIRRAEVLRIKAAQPEEADNSSSHFLTRAIGQWRNDPEFCTRAGEPKPLTISGKNADFRKLCAKVSAAINPGTVLFELERRSLVERREGELILLYRQLPVGESSSAGLDILSNDVNELIYAVEENLFKPAPITNLHLRTEFDNIEPRYIPTIRRWLLDEGKEFHRRARNFLSQFDRDLNPGLTTENSQPGSKVSVGTHSLTPLADEWKHS